MFTILETVPMVSFSHLTSDAFQSNANDVDLDIALKVGSGTFLVTAQIKTSFISTFSPSLIIPFSSNFLNDSVESLDDCGAIVSNKYLEIITAFDSKSFNKVGDTLVPICMVASLSNEYMCSLFNFSDAEREITTPSS